MMIFKNLLDFSPRFYQIPAYRLLAIFIGLIIPARFAGKGLQGLIILLAFLMLFTPELRRDAMRTLRQLLKKREAKWLAAVMAGCIPSLFVTISFEDSVRVWGLGIIILLLCGALCCFRYAPERDKRLAMQILTLGLFITCGFMLAASFFSPETLIPIFALRETIGFGTVKDPTYYSFITPKILLNGVFIAIPLLCYGGIFYFQNNWWRMVSFATIILIMLLVLFTQNRAVMAGLIAMVAMGGVCFWLFGRVPRFVKYGLPAMLIIMAVAYGFWRSDATLTLADNQKFLEYEYGRWDRINDDKIFPSFLPYGILGPIRQVFLYEAFRTWQENPLWGIGINTTSGHQDLQQNVAEYFTYSHILDSMTYVHNRFMEMLLETGFAGFIPFIIFLGMVFYGNLMRFIRTGSPAALLVLLAHAGYWSSGAFQFSIWELWIFMMFATSLILSIALEPMLDDVKTSPR